VLIIVSLLIGATEGPSQPVGRVEILCYTQTALHIAGSSKELEQPSLLHQSVAECICL
jgi:hypothetical protein